MFAGPLFAAKRRLVLGLTTALTITLPASSAIAQAPGGFVEKADSTAIRPRWTASEIRAFLPARGKFIFPAPYDAEGIRLTNSTDCGGTDCVSSFGMNNHRGRQTMLIFLGLRGVGPTLFSVDKATERVRSLGPLFDPGSPYAASSGEGWYFSATRPASLYVTGASGPKLQRYDVLAKTFETVFNAATRFGDGRSIGQPHSSDDDNVHSATLRDSASGAGLGCLVYREDAEQFSYYPAKGSFDRCQIDKSGRWLVIQDDVDGIAGYDSRIIDLETGAEKVLLGQKGGGGPFETGYGYMIAADRWNGLPGALRVWNFDESPLQGTVVYHDAYFGSAGVGPITHSNAQPGVTLSQQYACAGSATSRSANRSNEIVCFRLDDSKEVLVVTQVMTDLNAAGGGDRNGKQPTGMLDVTGGYFLWTSNMGGRRSDAFLVKVPSERLTGTGSDAVPPAAPVTEPARESTSIGVAAVLPEPALAVTATLPNPTLLPTATIAQVPLTAAYSLLNVPSKAAGGFYLDPTTAVKIYKLTSATFPAAGANWGHDYSEGGDEVSLPYNGTTRAILVYSGSSHWLIDFTPGVGVSNPRPLTGTLAPWIDLAFAFSNNPATPYYAYVSNGTTVRRIDIRTMSEAPGNGWPITDVPDAGGYGPIWLHQAENDSFFTWMRGANGPTVVGYEPSTGTLKTYTNAGLNEPRIDRAGRYIGISMSTPYNGLTVWDWQTNAISWTTPGDPGPPFAHNASLKRRWITVDWNLSFPDQFVMYSSDAPNSGTHIGGPANGTEIHCNGNWIQSPANLNDQWAMCTHYGSLQPTGSTWLAPGAMVLLTPNGERRILGHPYNTTGNYTFFTFAKFSSDGQYVLFTSDMNGSGRSDLFLAEVPSASIPDTTPPTVSISAPAAGATVSGTLIVSASAADDVGVAGVQFKLDGSNLGAEAASAPFSVSWNTSLSVDGSHTLTAVARDAAGNSTVSAAVVVAVSNVLLGPVISLVTSSSISNSGATMTWTTDTPSDSQVEYGPIPAYGSSTALDTSLVVSHSQTLSGLAPATLYHYRVKARNGGGGQTVSGDFTFTTLPDPNPGPIAYLRFDEGSGTTIADASGNGNAGSLMNGAGWTPGVSGQAAALDGVDDYVLLPHAAALDAFPLSVTVWFRTSATTGVSGLVNKYVAGSYDGYQVFFTSGDLCAWYLRDATNYVYDGGACPLRATGYNDGLWHQAAFVVDASGGRLYVDGAAKGSLPWTGQYGPPTTVQDVHLGHYPGAFGGVEYLAGAVDELRIYSRALSAGDVLQIYNDSGPATLDTIPPVASLTAPLAGQTLAGSVVVSASASDNVGVVGVQLKLDGSSLGAELTGAPYSVSWNTTGAANGSHALTAVARDAAGNSAVSAVVNVTVSNNPAPVISSASASGVSSSGATLNWSTDVPADSQVEYGPTVAYGSSTILNTTLVVSHAQALSGLAAGTLYHYRVKSRSGAGTLAVSGDLTFTTTAGADPSLIAYLKLDEGTGTVAADASGHGNAGTLMNGASWTAGRSGQAAALDGVNDYVRIRHAATLDAFPLSASVWFKTSSTTGIRGLLNKYVSGSYNGLQIFLNKGNLCAWYLRNTSNYVYDGGTCTLSTAGYNDGRWHQAVFVVDASGGRLYVDGIQKGSRSWTGLPGRPTTAQDVHLGHYPGASGTPYLPGAIDALRIYSRALSASEVLQLYNGQP
jgi:hypothetical protein